MDGTAKTRDRSAAVWLDPESGDFANFVETVNRVTEPADWPLAARVAGNVAIYEGERVRAAANDAAARRELTAEWVGVFDSGPGIIVIKGAMSDKAVVDRATEIFEAIIERQRADGTGAGDHFAKPGANDRVWNALEKHCLADPSNFADYYASDAIAMAAEAWLGAGYQVTAQVNRVNPGGSAQKAHRDYHLGFMTPAQIASYPAHIHRLSPVLTLQGAVAHCDMPLESGPTLYLPYSQLFFEGYLAFGRKEFQDYFAANHVQLPLEEGDAIFFNPAVMHGAGANTSSNIFRMANLLQIGSAFGRSIERVDRLAMVKALYPVLSGARQSGSISAGAIANVVAASAEGYAFPTDLDHDLPEDGLAPRTQAARLMTALEEDRSNDDFAREIDMAAKRKDG